MWTELYFSTSTKSQVTPRAAPGKLKSSASHRDDVKDEVLAVLAQTKPPLPLAVLLTPLACTLHGHCEDNSATTNGLTVSHCLSKVRDTIDSEQGTSCCSHANFFPCWGKLGILNPGTRRELCGSPCQPFPVRSTLCWQPPSDTAWLVSPGLQGCHVCSGIGGWAANCTGHPGMPRAESRSLPDCSLASTVCLQSMQQSFSEALELYKCI